MKLVFFHNSDNLIKKFTPELALQFSRTDNTYYWINDRYTHFVPWNPRYFHLFLKKPKTENIKFFIRQVGEKYEGLIKNYKFHKDNESKTESPILISKDILIPDLIADAGEDVDKNTKIWTILFPKEHEGKKIYLRDENNNPIPFNQDKTLIKIFPELNNSIPFQMPEDYTEWNSISLEELQKHE